MINTPTSVAVNSSTAIDHFIISLPDLFHNAGAFDSGLTDHSLIYASRKKFNQKHTVK